VSEWFQREGRDLPWRRPGFSAWGILISEVMLQQTPVVRVIPRLTEWLERWRRCVGRNDIKLPAAKAHGNEIVLQLPAKYAGQPPPPVYLRMSLRCGDAAGGPPAGSSLIVRAGVVRLYKPKACLLPVKQSP